MFPITTSTLLSSLTLLSFLTLTALLPTATAWEVDLFSDTQCIDLTTNGHGINAQDNGPGITCLPYGGNSWLISYAAGCSFYSWSGSNCEGSEVQDQFGVDNCMPFSFGSIQVIC